jgi:hypothetical protein
LSVPSAGSTSLIGGELQRYRSYKTISRGNEMKVGLVGFFGFGNFGDELFLDVWKKFFDGASVAYDLPEKSYLS